MGEWPRVSAMQLQSERALRIEDGNHGEYRPRKDEFVNDGVAFIRAADLQAGAIDFTSASKINDTALRRITKGVGEPGDVLLTHKGTVGRVARAPHDAPPFVCSPQTTFWRSLDNDRIDQGYLYAYLRSPSFSNQLRSRSAETDMAPYVSLTAQRQFYVVLPPIGVQRAIASIVGAFDDKVDLNRRMIQTLESIARAIFNSWFVDFEPVWAKAESRDPGLPAHIADLFPDFFDLSEIGVFDDIDRRLSELALLSRIRDGERPAASALDLVAAPSLDPADLFSEPDDDELEEDDPEDITYERVDMVGRHIRRCLDAAEHGLDHAIFAASEGHRQSALEALRHVEMLVKQTGESFDLWCEVLEGVLSQTGSYPGVAGEQVDAFTRWHREQRRRDS